MSRRGRFVVRRGRIVILLCPAMCRVLAIEQLGVGLAIAAIVDATATTGGRS
jgi:hypothetical protein